MVAVTEEAVDPGLSGTEGFERDVQRLADYFYVDNGLLALMQETRLQRVFDTLPELFYQVGLHTNVAKMVNMACQP